MSFLVGVNDSVSILHILRDLAGTGVITGQLANISYLITAPSGTQTTTGVTWTEPNADGYYLGSRTYASLGAWHVEVDDSVITGSAGGKHDYYIQVVANAAGAIPLGSFLTTLTNFKEQIEETGTANDDYYTNLIARATQRIERLVGRPLILATYTERYDGGRGSIELRKGPVGSILYVADVIYDSAGVASTASIAAGNYLPHGLLTDGWNLPGSVHNVGGVWAPGQRNYEVKYTAGYSAVPYDLESACLDLCVWYWNQRKDAGTTSRDIGDGSVTFRGSDELTASLRNELEHYVDMRAA